MSIVNLGAGSKNSSTCEQYSVKILNSEDLLQSYSLRYKVFTEELMWTKYSSLQLETDSYEDGSISFGVFGRGGELEASLRLIPSSNKYMLEQDFSFLVEKNHKIRKSLDTAEITRLCMKKVTRKKLIEYPFGKHSVSLLLYRELFQWCLLNNIRYIYMVVELKVLRLLNIIGFPCGAIGEPIKMPDGVFAIAAILDWNSFNRLNRDKNPEFLKWFLSEELPNNQLFQQQCQQQLLETG